MKKPKFTIGSKIFGGFISLIVIFAINAAVSIITISNSNTLINENTEVIDPSVKAIDEFILLVTESKMLVTNWVYLQNNQEDKEALKDLHSFRYPELKDKLGALLPYWQDTVQRQTVDSVFIGFEELIDIEKDIMSQLVSFEDYEDAMVKWQATEAVESEVLPRTNKLKDQLYKISSLKREEADQAQASIIASSDKLSNIILILCTITILIGLLGAFWLTRNITKPINYLKELIQRLGKGELPQEEKGTDNNKQKVNHDEVGDMAKAVDILVNGLRDTSEFAEQIGEGNYQASFSPLSEHDVLGNALINMRDNLQKVAEDDKKRNWATEGSAKFGEILRQNNHSVEELSNTILSDLIKYLNANQGGMFIVQDTDGDEAYMKLEACYAWDRQKYVEQKVYKGEGLVGQSWQEKDTIFLTDVPENYIAITSGLGDSNPTSILIVPLLVNEEVYGAIEIASFQVFKDYEIEFLQKIAESIASTISSAKVNSRTQQLLEESTQMTEQMRAQEEEMRQNMEELQATQEEMNRKQRSMTERESRIKAVLDTALASFISIGANGELDFFNKNTQKMFGYTEQQLSGINVSAFFKNVGEGEIVSYLREHLHTQSEHTLVNKDGLEFEAEIKLDDFSLNGQSYFIARIVDVKAYANQSVT
ncbi:PAS domain S-box-containing protein [Catalinimonas alkaloidigena]|uniref:GAF domain-containing protein n=1 Tax=Catalinimonas alkaloidigena TaxID=1075417 RepID=UPI0024070307|nr:GAF domain-containing protein [Catalinimonas alkaloidigena]MDF9800724.1 PAS domain S-box-containing protein [Catalinimonas alkaloidigena]